MREVDFICKIPEAAGTVERYSEISFQVN